MAAASTARTVAMIGTARATSSISATGPDTVATMISAAARLLQAVISRQSDSHDFERPRKPRRNERSHEDYGFSYDERSHDGRRQSMRNTRQGEGGKRIHRKNENRIVRDERSEGAKRHERRMIAKYGNTEGPNRRHSKKNRHNAPFRMKSGRR